MTFWHLTQTHQLLIEPPTDGQKLIATSFPYIFTTTIRTYISKCWMLKLNTKTRHRKTWVTP